MKNITACLTLKGISSSPFTLESERDMKISYSRDVDILMLELDQSLPISHAEHVGNTIIHLSPDQQPVLIEILQAREFVSALVDAVMQPDAVA